MPDVFLETLADLVLDSRGPGVVGSIRGRFLVIDAFTCLLHPLRGRIHQIFGVGNLLLDEFQFALDPLGRSLTVLMIVDDPGSLVVSRLGPCAFPMIRQLHSLPTRFRYNVVPKG
ncbi:hypothetical protein [Mycolicibacterium lutetiense]